MRIHGLSFIIGGFLWSILWSIVSTRPEGTIYQYRDIDDLKIWILLSWIFILFGVLSYIKHNKKVIKIGSILFLIGFISIIAQPLFELPWTLVSIGLVTVVFGLILFGVGSYQSKLFSKYSSLLLIIGAFILFFFNTEDWRVWLALPFGISWIMLGYEILKQQKKVKNSSTWWKKPD